MMWESASKIFPSQMALYVCTFPAGNLYYEVVEETQAKMVEVSKIRIVEHSFATVMGIKQVRSS